MRLNENFNQQEFIDWIGDFLPDFSKDIRKVDVSKSFQGIKSIQTIGESALSVRVYIIETEQDPSKRKIGLATESFTLLRNYGTPNAIIVYYSENSSLWRLSLLTSTLTWDEGKIKKKLSNPKRQSYVLGSKAKVKTPHQYLISKGAITDFNDLKGRFSLEVVNKEFYKEISHAFIQLVGGQITNGKSKKTVEAQLKLPFVKDQSQTSQEFAVRLIGRIIFCWFLREKRSASGHSLMPKELLSFDASSTIEDYYHKILEPIFFEVLNKPIKTRKETFINDLFSAIPYLNGGLFSPHEDDFFNYNEGKQAINHNIVVVPDLWLKSLFEVLETYNFTIDENTSFDEELSIDPEMLGRIFENLLAEINPETGESARKSTGSYYTPRVIVDYMVDESLHLYLHEKTNIPESKLRSLISYDLEDDNINPLKDEEKDSIAQALGAIKILDPACGSGAFPIGALQKIVFILQQIDQNGQLWFKKQIQNTPIELRKVIEREFQEKNFDYIRKLGIIRENIYGIDIQPIATEISRLRCFLTLVVDERIDDTLENRGIEPLPNLDFKFVTANTLVGLPTTSGSTSQMGLFEDDAGIKELKEVRDMFFNASGFERDQLKLQFAQTQNRMLHKLIDESRRGHADMTAKLTSWDPFSHKMSDWFDPEWMFGLKNGFDLVIANPPYIDSEGMVKNHLEYLREYLAENYKFTRGNWDIYIAFFEKGFNTLNENGILTYISPDKWISKPFGTELRKQKFTTMYSLLNAGRKIFESAKVDSIVSIFHNKKTTDKLKVYKIIEEKITFLRDFDKKTLKAPYTLDGTFSPHLNLISKLDKYVSASETLNCENACATSDAYKLSPLVQELDESFNENYLKIINTGTIGKWLSKWGKKEMTYLGKKYLKPVVKKDQFFHEFTNSYSRKSVKPKLILKGLNLLDVCLDELGEIIPGKSTLLITGFELNKLKLLMAYLNSPLPVFYLKEKYPASSYNQGTTFTKDMINNLPVPATSSDIEAEIINAVDKLIMFTSDDLLKNSSELMSKVAELREDVNSIIYKSFDLSDDEILIVENNSK
ncbi:hypothetical protein A2356_01355 [Candidatus Nomurabacteria bacterium RIFOXYB1_FULL_39_16]|uniref:site-specific DNA-methyltransferase (adenine-specific) n=1 Tax=Candidatus Nomurabacteria bacterium RIFOXYB1_FULL_39_16 TaxID=1801803 RepID=A0A1F6YUT4_9BACT|nr:MAG: hypothetical protein A2356_01355 [Candidatus Nomurabacteria bacterium RIFOXYB1_FULL_39_16]OGJ15260.1 MAG: hypothetical protein A2585_02260 [Candidatus Nomurabacteria bacterium RIFOXYD1_FULL_39_12]